MKTPHVHDARGPRPHSAQRWSPNIDEASIDDGDFDHADSFAGNGLMLLGSPRSCGIIHEMASMFAREHGDEHAIRDAFCRWSRMAREHRHEAHAIVWWAHSIADSALKAWFRMARNRRVLGASVRVLLRRDIAGAYARWKLWGAMRHMGQHLDTLGLLQVRRVSLLRRWRAYVCLSRTSALSGLAGDLLETRRCLWRWQAACTDPDTRRVLVVIGAVSGTEGYWNGSAGSSQGEGTRHGGGAGLPFGASCMMHASMAVACRHHWQRARVQALSAWRLNALGRHLRALEARRAWQPIARRALLSWCQEATAATLRWRLSQQRQLGRGLLALALTLRTWRGLLQRAPLERLRNERTAIGMAVVAIGRWRRHTDWALGGRRYARRAPQRRAALAYVADVALSAAKRRLWRRWQLRRVDLSLVSHASVHWEQTNGWTAFGHWVAMVDRRALANQLGRVASASAVMFAARCGWRGLVAALASERTLQTLAYMRLRVAKRRAREAILLWQLRSGGTPLPVYRSLCRAYELARVLLLLFAWRVWVDRSYAERNDELLIATLPLLHALRRWGVQVKRTTALSQAASGCLVQQHAQELPLRWRAWLAHVSYCQEEADQMAAASVHARRLSVSRGVRSIAAAAQLSATFADGARLHYVMCAAASAMRQWRSCAAAQARIRRTLHQHLGRSGEYAYGLQRWKQWRDLHRRRAQQDRRAQLSWRSRALGSAWARLCCWAATRSAKARALALLDLRRGGQALATWRVHRQWLARAADAAAAERRRAVSRALAAWRAHAMALPAVSARLAAHACRWRRTSLKAGLTRLVEGFALRLRDEQAKSRAHGTARRMCARRAVKRLQAEAQRRTTQIFLGSLSASDANGSGDGFLAPSPSHLPGVAPVTPAWAEVAWAAVVPPHALPPHAHATPGSTPYPSYPRGVAPPGAAASRSAMLTSRPHGGHAPSPPGSRPGVGVSARWLEAPPTLQSTRPTDAAMHPPPPTPSALASSASARVGYFGGVLPSPRNDDAASSGSASGGHLQLPQQSQQSPFPVFPVTPSTAAPVTRPRGAFSSNATSGARPGPGAGSGVGSASPSPAWLRQVWQRAVV